MLFQLKKQLPSSILMLAILVIGAGYLFKDTMNKYPAYVHAWTQSDRIAIAQNFQQNGFDLFHPATYNLLTKDGITRVDFPIHDYAVAIISSITNTSVVPVFHWYNLIYSIIGLFFLFQLLLLFTKSPMRSILGTTFVFTLPFFVYYQNGFLPSTASFANLFIGLFFIFNSSITKKGYTLGVVFITLAALARAPFFIFLFGLLLSELLQEIRFKNLKPLKLIQLFVGVLLFIGYYAYNQYLGNTYGSMFLTETLHFTSFSNFIEVISGAVDRWTDQLMSPYHAILLLLLICTCLYQYKRLSNSSNRLTFLLSYLLISSTGISFFFFAFGRQFIDHDYYYIDSFLPLLTFWIIFMLSSISIPKKWYSIVGTICFIFFFYFFGHAKDVQTARYTPSFDDRIEYAYNVYSSVKTDLFDSWKVTKQDTILVIGANSTNIPFTIWGVKGYSNLKTRASVLAPELDSSFTYAAMVDSFFYKNVYRDYPPIINKLEKINGNGELSLYKKSSNSSPSNFFDLLHYEFNTDYSNTTNSPKTPIVETDSLHGKAAKIQEKNIYTLTLRDTIRKKIENKPLRAMLVGDYFQNDSSKIQIVFAVGDYYGARYTISELKTIGEWQKKQFSFYVDPSQFKVGDQWTIYFWNPNKTTLTIDNTNFILFQ